MKQETVKKIVDAYFDVFEQLSIRSFSQGFACVVDSMEKRLKVLKQIRTREELQTMLMREPEPELFVLEERIAQIRFLPYMIRKVIPLSRRWLMSSCNSLAIRVRSFSCAAINPRLRALEPFTSNFAILYESSENQERCRSGDQEQL